MSAHSEHLDLLIRHRAATGILANLLRRSKKYRDAQWHEDVRTWTSVANQRWYEYMTAVRSNKEGL